MPVISAVDMMKLFLYGKDDLPKFDSEEPIRPLGSEHQVRHYQDFATYMDRRRGALRGRRRVILDAKVFRSARQVLVRDDQEFAERDLGALTARPRAAASRS